MLKNLTVIVDNRPGGLAGACEAVGHAGINIEGMCCFASQGVAILYLAVKDGLAARRALERVGVKVSEERDVVAVPVGDTVGAAGHTLRRIADAGINIDLAYLATGPRIVIGTKELEKVQAILHC